ncbi:CPLN2 protein, partial [Cnemophilus loriae]|nr:CPLN2 protein [Cnemophilus loriae]
PGWLLSPAGRTYLDSILHKNQRRVFGLLERPALPPALAVPTVTYKLFLSGRSGVGKTALVAWLGPWVRPGGVPGLTVPPVAAGIEATTLFWPAKPRASGRPVLFQLHLWD